jgi:hypothetical protein
MSKRKKPTEEDIKKFNELIPLATKVHTYTWCEKNAKLRLTVTLRAEECLYCGRFILNGGTCDPL